MAADLKLKTQQIDHYIGGKYVPSSHGKTFDSINPATGEVIAKVALGTADDIDKAAKAAHDAFENGPWARMSLKERCDVLVKVGDLILERKELLARAETMDAVKPISESLEG